MIQFHFDLPSCEHTNNYGDAMGWQLLQDNLVALVEFSIPVKLILFKLLHKSISNEFYYNIRLHQINYCYLGNGHSSESSSMSVYCPYMKTGDGIPNSSQLFPIVAVAVDILHAKVASIRCNCSWAQFEVAGKSKGLHHIPHKVLLECLLRYSSSNLVNEVPILIWISLCEHWTLYEAHANSLELKSLFHICNSMPSIKAVCDVNIETHVQQVQCDEQWCKWWRR